MTALVETLAPAPRRPLPLADGVELETNLGDGIALAAGPLLVASLTHDAFLVSLAALLQLAPPLLFGLFAGRCPTGWTAG